MSKVYILLKVFSYRCSNMGRKVGLAVYRKNSERKKKAARAKSEQIHSTSHDNPPVSEIPPNSQWHKTVHDGTDHVTYSKVVTTGGLGHPSRPCITCSVEVKEGSVLTVLVHNQELNIKRCKVLPSNPDLATLLHVDGLKICPGNPDIRFMDMAAAPGGKFKNKEKIQAFVDGYAPVTLNGEYYTSTIRSTSCDLLTRDAKCEQY